MIPKVSTLQEWNANDKPIAEDYQEWLDEVGFSWDDGTEKEKVAERIEEIIKDRRYVDDPSDAPEGVEVHEGDRKPDATYYFTEEVDDGGETPDVTFDTSGFTPAETVEEAESFAQENILRNPEDEGEDEIGELELDYGELPIDAINEINETLYQFTQNDHLPNLKQLKQDSTAEKNASAFASANGIVFKTSLSAEEYNRTQEEIIEEYQPQKIESVKGDIDYLENNIKEMERRAENEEDSARRERMLENVEQYREQKEEREEQLQELREQDADRPYTTGNYEELTAHEYAHVIDEQFGTSSLFHDKIRRDVFRGTKSDAFKPHGKKYARRISDYATTNTQEYVAESFVAYMNGETERLEENVVEFWDTMVGKRGPNEEWGDLTRWKRQ